jgi:uncharacterized membrane protein (DUF485 family)
VQQPHHHLTPSDWDTVAAAPRFRAFIAGKRRFIVPATIFFLLYYMALPVLVGFDPILMGRPVWGPLTVAFAFALSQFLMTWILLALYIWRARAFDATESTIVDDVRKEFA